MNKIFNIIKSILISITLYLLVNYLLIFNFEYGNPVFLTIFIILLFIIFINNIVDIIKKRNFGIRYNILYILILLIIDFVFIRTLYDKNFIYNSVYYLNLVKEITQDRYNVNLYILKEKSALFLDQNLIYFILMFIGIILYRKIKLSEIIESKYSIPSIICFMLSIISFIPSMIVLQGDNINEIIYYLIFTLILIGIEIYSLIKYNHKKREWLIYISFVFNLFALISIFASFITA